MRSALRVARSSACTYPDFCKKRKQLEQPAPAEKAIDASGLHGCAKLVPTQTHEVLSGEITHPIAAVCDDLKPAIPHARCGWFVRGKVARPGGAAKRRTLGTGIVRRMGNPHLLGNALSRENPYIWGLRMVIFGLIFIFALPWAQHGIARADMTCVRFSKPTFICFPNASHLNCSP